MSPVILPCAVFLSDPEEHFDDVCVTGADGANAAASGAVAHASAGVSNTKKQLKLTSFFK